MMRHRVGVASMLCSMWVFPLAAQRFEWGVAGGYSWEPANIGSSLSNHGAVLGGDSHVRAGSHLSFGLEGSIERLNQGHGVVSAADCGPFLGGLSAGIPCSIDGRARDTNMSLAFTFRLRPRPRRFAPYLLLGIGALRVKKCESTFVHYASTYPDVSHSECDSRSLAELPVAAGLVYRSSLPFAVTLETRATPIVHSSSAYWRSRGAGDWHPSVRLGVRTK